MEAAEREASRKECSMVELTQAIVESTCAPGPTFLNGKYTRCQSLAHTYTHTPAGAHPAERTHVREERKRDALDWRLRITHAETLVCEI